MKGGESFFFFTRPRRFGKSLTVSTLKAIFEGKKELFKDTYIYDKYDFKEYPVVHISMSSIKGKDISSIILDIKDILFPIAIDMGVYDQIEYLRNDSRTYSIFARLLEAIHRKYKNKIVVLIDEYDSPLLDNLQNPEFDEIRKVFANFYSVLKDSESIIKFCFITGITRISHVSIFSKLNNLVNISDYGEYSALCGFTEEELDKYFKQYFEIIYSNYKLYSDEERKAFRDKIREYYDGYRFSPYANQFVYNPVSIGTFFKLNSTNSVGFQNFWIDTGAMSVIRDLVRMRIDDLTLPQPYLVSFADRSLMEVTNIFEKSTPKEYIYAYLFQCGYLTIKEVDNNGKLCLVYPNEEVSSAIGSMIVNAKYGSKIEPKFVSNLISAFENEDIPFVVSAFNSLYSSLP